MARARDESSLSFQVSGTIARVTVAVGDWVKAGAPIARLDPEHYDLQAEEAEAALRRAEAAARNEAANLRRTRALYETENASATELDAALAASDSAAAQVDALGRRLELARLRSRRTQLAAPVNGEIAEAMLEAERHDPERVKRWVVLVDGAGTQLDLVEAGAAGSGVEVTVILDIIHVVEYVWKAARVFHPEGSPELSPWAWTRVRSILEGKATGWRRRCGVRRLSPACRRTPASRSIRARTTC